MVFDTCKETVAQLPLIPLDKNNPDDVDTKYKHDHIYDALRYGVMSRPRGEWFTDNREDQVRVSDPVFGY
jgi:hypothetical protein